MEWNNKSHNQHIALKAFFVLLAVGLQKPGPKSKAKDHKECLKKRLASWKSGEIARRKSDSKSYWKRKEI